MPSQTLTRSSRPSPPRRPKGPDRIRPEFTSRASVKAGDHRIEESRCSTDDRCYNLPARKTVSAHTISIALLPFESLSPSASDSWLAVGFVQDLIAEIARFPTLRVISAQSSFAPDAAGVDDATIGRRLECWLRGLECLQQETADSDEETRGFFELALKIDPHFALGSRRPVALSLQ